ncbi:glycoside hydrolase family 2 protein [Microbacterium horticulturae]|uniref:beta-mannosidase n=1 Tax=Microbacterium horticulturae TaxID=3028316 RepID=A0ABY8BZL5_9MICO|nr:glycoside hydrolase family 2 protein [Microbacterium sp. KACC 23027]WEG08038.1 glycoside hydrolase family 2 protein [Microbacterium sp. KACC 23027]
MTSASTVQRRLLHEGWSLRAVAGPVPAEVGDAAVPAVVPGVVHLDLMREGLIPDPYLDDNEALLAWIGLTDWTYETEFEVSADAVGGRRHELVFDGLDTVATVTLNGSEIARVQNQHRTHRIDVTGVLRAGTNHLVVAFRSPVKYADAQSLVYGPRPRPYPTPYEAIRKSACSFGWDWGIVTATSGIWRPVRLESWASARLGDVRVVATPAGDDGRVEVTACVSRADETPLRLVVDVAGASTAVGIPAGDTDATAVVELDHVERWWPAGHGAQPLYDVHVALQAGADTIDKTTRRVGFRTLCWEMTPDAAGTPFQLIVNGRPIFVKGVNWIPDDAFPSRVDRERYARRLGQARAAHVNLVRVWGGGVYESDDFYDVCDELGLLTWQDFLFACAAYPEEEPLRSEIAAEARQNVDRIAHHASLALLCGNNENIWGHEEWGWDELLDGRTWGEHYYRELLPAIVAERAPHVPYIPGSPFSPDEARHPNDEAHGSVHLWEQWNQRDWPTYREHTPRFVAEFGWQGPPAWSTLTRAVSDDPLTPESPGMIVHQKALDGNTKMSRGLVAHYRVPVEMGRWHWAMQLNQANAVTAALDWFRAHAPHTSGAIVWQLNDCWPVTSWAAIDGDGHEKPLFFALQNAFAPRVVVIEPDGDGLAAVLGNDTDEPWEGEVIVTRRDFDGGLLAQVRAAASLPPRTSQTLPIAATVATAGDAAAELLVVEALDTRGVWFFAEPRDSSLAAPRARVAVQPAGDGFDVTVTAEGLLRDATLLVDPLAPTARVDRGLVTLLPGEAAVFRVSGVDTLDADAAASVLRSGNELM